MNRWLSTKKERRFYGFVGLVGAGDDGGKVVVGGVVRVLVVLLLRKSAVPMIAIAMTMIMINPMNPALFGYTVAGVVGVAM